MAMLGERLRELRASRNLTLKQVSDETSLSISFLSLVERDKVSISVDHLETLARYYGIRMVSLFQGVQENSFFVTRQQQTQEKFKNAAPGRSDFLLLSYQDGARMEPLMINIGPGHGDSEFRSMDADVLLYVIAGCMRVISERGEEVALATGDSLYFFGFPGHRLLNGSQTEPATILIVTTPPTTLRDDILDGRRGVLLQSEK